MKKTQDFDMEIYVRKATISDIPKLTELYKGVIHTVNRKDYPDDEIEDWASCGDNEEHIEKLITELYFIVAENTQSQIIGFESISDKGHLHSMFVHKDFQRQGIASLLYREIENYARERNFHEITSEVSITARPFFEKQGFLVNEEWKRKANKLRLTNYKMSKRLR